MTLEYETYRLRDGEAFIVFIDSVEVLKVTGEKDSSGLSKQ